MPKQAATNPDLVTKVWVSEDKDFIFPEQESGVLPRAPETGVCFSGGGTRAMCAAMGQLRGLIAADLLGEIDYMSCVSGGSWAATVFTYYQSGASDDAALLGPVTPPGKITAAHLNTLSPTSLGATATRSFRDVIWGLAEDLSIPRDQVWIETVGQVFFAPFGLYTPKTPAYFSLNDATVAEIRSRNPELQDAPFHLPRNPERPYLVINACLIWPVGDLQHENCVVFEYTPLTVGSPFRLKLGYKPALSPPRYRTVGGGFIEPFAYGCSAPGAPPDAKGCVEVAPPAQRFTLVDASGTSSSAYARIFDEAAPFTSPHMNYWPVTKRGHAPTHDFAFGDGGNLENYGVIGLLLRKVRRILVFINTDTPLSLDYSPSDPMGTPPSVDDMDEYLPPLFGVPVKEYFLFDKDPYPHNQVFSHEAFTTVVSALQAAKKAGNGAIAVTELTVQSNDWWGVQGQSEVTVGWFYLDRVSQWESQLPADIRHDIEIGNDPLVRIGPFKDFPHYRTIDEQFLDLVQFTSGQVNLLADLTCWTVTENADLIRRLLSGKA